MQEEMEMLQRALEREKSARESLEKRLEEKERELALAQRQMADLDQAFEERLAARLSDLNQANRRLESTYHDLSALIQSLQAGILVEDEERQIVLANKRFCDLFQIPAPPAQLTGMDCSQSAEQSKHLFKEPEQFVQRIQDRLAQRELVLAEPMQMENGRFLERDYIPVWGNNGEYLGHLWKYEDVTIQKLERRKLEAALEQLTLAAKAREDFLASMSHEIRTPMNAILGMTELLLSSPMTAKQAEQARVIRKSSENLLVLVNDLLDISKIDAGKFRLEKIAFRLDELLDYIVHTLEPAAKARNIGLSLHMDPAIPQVLRSDPHRINQVLTNLVTNAIKFTERGSVRLETELLSFDQGVARIEFRIVDTGIGIAAEKLERIFESFQQADATITRRFGGTGLGLTISRKLALLLGGEISVKSKPGQGTTFILHLALEVAEESEIDLGAKAIDLSSEAFHGKRVLLVEDHEYNQILTVSFLEEWGIQTEIAHNGQEALDQLRKGSFDLVLMDIQMPLMDGLQATSVIRNEMGLQVPILALSATAQQSEEDRCRAVGMDDFLSKPFSRAALHQKLHRLLLPLDRQPEAPQRPLVYSFDLDLLHQHVNGNPALVQKLVEVFLRTTPPELSSLQEAGRSGSLAAAREVIHRLRPSVKMMGMHAVLGKMQQLSSLQEGQDAELRGLAEDIAAQLDAALQEMAHFDQ